MEIFKIVRFVLNVLWLFWFYKKMHYYYFKFNKFEVKEVFLRNKEFFVEMKRNTSGFKIYEFLSQIWISILGFPKFKESGKKRPFSYPIFIAYLLLYCLLIYLMEEKVCMKYNIVMWKTIELRLPGLRNLYRFKASNWIRGDFYTFYSCP